MPIAIIFRKQLSVNNFRDMVIGALNSGCGDNAIICSGYFQEALGVRGTSYRASQEPGFIQALTRNEIALITVGIYNSSWKTSYVNFRDSLRMAGVNVAARYVRDLRWHAKVFILSHGQDPIFGIVGSSNITRPAFGTIKDFNYECDVVIWPKSVRKITNIINSLLLQGDIAHQVIRAPYLRSINGSLSIQDRLLKLKREILTQEFEEMT